jgi:hypothetical protein
MATSQSKRKGKRASPNSSTKSFQFIDLSNSNQKAAEDDRSIIREVVMSDYHRRKKHKTSSSDERMPPQGSVTVLDTVDQRINVFQVSQQTGGSVASINPALDPSSENDVVKPTTSPGEIKFHQHVSDESDLGSGSTAPAGETVGSPSDSRSSSRRKPRKIQATKTTNINEKFEVLPSKIIQQLDLLGGSLDPLISLPTATTSRTRLIIHHYCELHALSHFVYLPISVFLS